jgi:hypothetical protein
MFKLSNGKPIDVDMIEQAMQDSDLCNSYYLNTQTGEVDFLSDYLDTMEEREKRLEEIETSEVYIPIERIPSHEAYQWMEIFVAEIVTPKDAQVAEKLSMALVGKGAFRRFKDVLHYVGEEWVQAFYSWRDDQLYKAMKEWFAGLPVTIIEDTSETRSSS